MSAKSAIVLLRAYLDQSAAQGTSRVSLRSDARTALQHLVQSPPASRANAMPKRVFEEPLPLPPPMANIKPLAAPAEIINVPGNSVEERLAHLAALAENDPKPRALGSLRDTMVFAVGSPHARLMFIGEAPGIEEERQREPFVGPAGQKLTQIIERAMGLRRAEVYISNICKFRPSTGDNQGSSNRAPTPEEMRACLPYVLTEIDIIRPQVIVALGATASTGLGIEGPVGRLRSRWHEMQGIPVMVTYHPSYLIRRERDGEEAGTAAKRQVWEDMLLVMEKLGMPISDKQRSYFKAK
jgi:DNA polymerase